MAFEVSVGKNVPVPCRHCGVGIGFPITIGVRSLRCPACARATRVSVTLESDVLRIRTAAE